MAVVGLLTLLLAGAVPGEDLADPDLLRQAETAFHEGEHAEGTAARAAFARAAAAYESLRQRGYHSADLYRDQGNAYVLADDLPHAILAYHRGLRLRPNDSALQAGLMHARERVVYAPPGGFGRPPTRHRPPWLPRLTSPLGAGLALLLYLLGWAAVSGWLMRRQGGYLLAAACAFAVTALLAAGFVLEARQDQDEAEHPLVVIAQDGVFLHKGNGGSYPHFDVPLNQGVEARLRFDKGTWLQVELAGGEIGWVRRADVLVDSPGSL
jgi:hypothetical protein